MLFYHSGMIENSIGNKTAACYYLGNALAATAPFHPAEFRAMLRTISG